MFRVKKLDLLVLKAYVFPLLITFFVTTFLLLMQFLWKYIDDMVGKGLELHIILELFFYATVGLLQMSLPLAILCSSIFLYGSMGETNELIAIKSSGISLLRIMRPVIYVNVIVAILAFFYANNLLPYSNLRLWSLMYDIRNQRPELNIKEGVFFDGIEQVRLKIASKNRENEMMYDVMIYDHRKNYGNTNVTVADSASMKITDDKQYLILTLYNGKRYEDVVEGVDYNYVRTKRPFREQYFTKQQVLFELESFTFNRTDMDLFKHNSQMQNMTQLISTIDSMKTTLEYRNQRSFHHYYTNNIYRARSKIDEGHDVDVDTLFSALNNAYKIQSYIRALNYARSGEAFLTTAIENEQMQDMSLNKHRIELHKKFTLAFACLIMFFVGAPFGALVRKGGLGVPVIFSFIFYLLYYVLSMIGEKSVKSAENSAFQGMWYPTGIIVLIGIYFTYMAVHDKLITPPKYIFAYIHKKFSSIFHIFSKK
ncbi:MAG: putative permease YjgP/YjgQ family protein [Bacteroidetes bacterium ADurb.Bin217]|nr:MAG: putative permease YjgP/YjgQ family protein [Bacteroidetes bacterium ADurb.Bin217]